MTPPDQLVEQVAQALANAQGDERSAASAAIALVVRRCAEVFAEPIVTQGARVGVYPARVSDTPTQWALRVRLAAILSLSPDAMKDR